MSFFSKHSFRKVITMLSACGTLLGTTAYAQQMSADASILSMERNKTDNTPTLISFSPSAGWTKGQEQDIFKKYLGIDGVNTTMQLVYATTTKMNATSSRYAEYYKGIKIEYGSFTLTEKNGLIHFISGNFYNPTTDIPATPVVTETGAFNNALNYVHATKYMWQDAGMEARIKQMYHRTDTSYKPHGILTWIEDYNNGATDRKLHLAYSFDIYAQEPLSRQKVFVDAITGNILFSNSMIQHTAATGHSLYSQTVPLQSSHIGTIYELYDSTRGNGVHTLNLNHGTNYATATEITSTNTTFPALAADSTAVDAHWGGEMVYDYWNTQQGRLSWDNLNGILLQYVHYSNSYDNAYWDGTEMTYGDGSGCAGGGFTSLTSLDVTGHEIGHGVCQATANLVYASESGAINEGLSDCWGATIEHWADPHEVDAVAKQYWKIGEEIGCGTPLRSMDFPHNEGNPDTYGTNDPNWVNVTGCTPGTGNDQCGVHTNSGVTNKWYYLVVSGGTGTNANGTAYNVNAIGWTEAANILYQTELVMPTTCTYAQFRSNSIAVATTLYGACSPEVQCVTNAWYAVGVGTAFVPCTPQIGFTVTNLSTTEYTATTTCPASRTISIGLKATGNPITGGNPVVNVVVGHGTAIAGVDYTLSGATITFTAGDTTTHYATLTIFDNGVPNDSKNLVLGFTLATMGSTATISPTNDSMYINIVNNDSAVSLGGPEYHTLNAGTAVTSNNSSAFLGSNRRAHSQFLLFASELTAAGVRPGVPISQIAFNVTTKNSTAAFIGYTVSMANTAAVDLSTAFATGLTTVYTGNHTTNLGIDSIPFTTNFTWDGTSNVAVNVCYGQNAAAFTGNDMVSGIDHTPTIVYDRQQSNTGVGTGCTLTYSTGGQNTARPVVRFKQIAPPSGIATVLASTRTWTVNAGTQVNFYNPADTNLIATLNNESANLGCTSATLTAAGVGFTPAAFSPTTNRSVKQVTITPTTNGPTTTYDATIYLTNTELNGVAPNTLFLVKTEQPTDATISAANSTLLTPTLITGTNFVGFKGTFTGVNGSRFFLTDGPFCVAPTATITASGATTFCLGGSVTLNASTGTGYTYQWQSGTVNIPGATNASYTTSAAGSYRVVISQSACAGTSSAVVVTVDSAYAAPITGTTTNVCVGQSITLTDATATGTWASGNTGIATVDASGHIYGANGGSATISYTVVNGCGSATATTNVTVNSLPVISAITGTTTVCTGNITALTEVTTGGTWSSSNTAIATVAAGTVGGVSAGNANVTYSVTNTSGCTAIQTAAITVNASPVATITPAGPTTFCTGSNVVLNANTGIGLSYQWQVGGVDIAGATNASYTASNSGNYTVIVTNSSNCSTSSLPVTATSSIGLTFTPSVSFTASPGTVLCSSSSNVTYNATSVNGGSAPVYNWYVNGTLVGSGAAYNYIPANGDVVSCVLTSNAACVYPDTASSTVTMAVSPYSNPAVSINALPNDTVCAGTMATFVAVPVFGGTAPSYLWTKNGINVATGPAYNYVPVNGDVLICRMVSNYACRLVDTATSPALTITVDTNVINSVTIIANHPGAAPGMPLTFTAIAPHAGSSASYQWYVNGVPVAGATSSTYTTSTLINGQVVTCGVTSSEICAAPATAISGGITALITNSVNSVAGNSNNFTLMPNPNNGTFTIKGTLYTNDADINVKVTDMLGQVVYTTVAKVNNNNVNETISLQQSLASGVYMVNITSSTGNEVFHVVVSK